MVPQRRPAIEHFTQRVFRLPSARFFPRHAAMLGALRSLLAPAGLARRMRGVQAAMRVQLLESWPAESGNVRGCQRHPLFVACCKNSCMRPFFNQSVGLAWPHASRPLKDPFPAAQVELLQGVKDLLFRPTVAALFGKAFCARHGAAALQAAFFAFEAGFELAASPLPHFLQPGFCAARRTLLRAFR